MVWLSVILAVIGFAIVGYTVWPAARLQPRWLAPAIMAGLIVLAGATYLAGGQPQAPGVPYQQAAAERRAANPADLSRDAQIERLRDILREDETDAVAWAQLGRMLARSERELEAINAFQRSLRLDLNARTLSDLGQTFMNLNDGRVTDEARAAFVEAQRLDPDMPEPSFFLGLGAFQSGDIDEAETVWLDLIERLEDSDPYKILIAEQAFQLLSQPQVNAEAVEAAAASEDFDPGTRIAAMVQRLEMRVESGEAGFADYLRLIRVRGMVGDDPGGMATLVDARARFADRAGAMTILDLLYAALQSDEGQGE
jgi:cytochrome c-type biogenesis protein CcmH